MIIKTDAGPGVGVSNFEVQFSRNGTILEIRLPHLSAKGQEMIAM